MTANENSSARMRLADDHQVLDALLKSLTVTLDAGDPAKIFNELDLFWARLAMHIRAENTRLFPALLAAANYDLGVQTDPLKVREAIAKLREDHNFFMTQLAEAVQLARRLAEDNQPNHRESLDQIRCMVATVQALLETHNVLEEEFVYGLQVKLLSVAEQEELADGIRRELEKFPGRFSHA